jgi:hypothetical protein
MPQCAVGPLGRESAIPSPGRSVSSDSLFFAHQVVLPQHLGCASISMAGRRPVPARERPCLDIGTDMGRVRPRHPAPEVAPAPPAGSLTPD